MSDPEDIGDNITEAVEPAVILQGVGAGDAAAIVAGGEGAAVRLIGVVGGVIAPAPAGVLRLCMPVPGMWCLNLRRRR